MKRESVSEIAHTWKGVIAILEHINEERTQTQYDKGMWINRVNHITIKRDGLGWRVVQTLKKREEVV